MQQIFLTVLGFSLFIGLVLIHEWGHYFAARRNGVEVEEFGLGLPPRAWGKKLKSGMILSLNWLPLGGFVKMKGEHDSDERPGSFGAASLWSKTKIMMAGVTMNLLAGWLLLAIVALMGMPKLIDNQFQVAGDSKIIHQKLVIGEVTPGSPAAKAGLASRDVIEKLSNASQSYPVNSPEDLRLATQKLAGQTARIDVRRNAQTLSQTVVLASQQPYLGINYEPIEIIRSTWSAPIVAIGFSGQLFELTIKGVWQALSGLGSYLAGFFSGNQAARDQGYKQATDDIGGPVAIGAILWGSGTFGLNFVIFVIGVISLTLALINILPVPVLDGGRLTMTAVSRGLLKRPLSKRAEERLVGGSMALLILLFVLITIVDVRRFF